MDIKQSRSVPMLQVWFATAAVAVEPCIGDEEAEAIGRLAFDRDRQRSMRCHSLKRRLLARHLSAPPQHLRFTRDAGGKPHLLDGALQFNLSHSEDAFALAMSTQPVGVDIQWRDPALDCTSIADTVLHPAELHLWTRQDRSRNLFFRLWAAKEAVLKAEGSGLLDDPRRIDASAWTGDRCHVDVDGRRWCVTARDVDAFVLCVATPEQHGMEVEWLAIDAGVLRAG